MRGLTDICELTPAELDELIAVAGDIIARPEAYREACRGKKLATLFFEPSTRTRLSFEAAMYELGGNVLSVSSAASSSAAKGESVADTAQVVSCYADIIAMRHPKEGAPLVAATHASIPVINAGDGGHNHPTQTLADLLTIHREKGRLGHLTVGLCGDLKYGRTVHSLIAAMSRYEGVRFVLISPDELKLPGYVKKGVLQRYGVPYDETADLLSVMPELDVLYMTRVQRERFPSEEEYARLRDSYILTPDKLETAKPELSILHPLPRVNEISVAVDQDPRACYFKQVLNGKYMRMALILKLLGIRVPGAPRATASEAVARGIVDDICAEKKTCIDRASVGERSADLPERLTDVICCQNPRCITSTEQELPQVFLLEDREERSYRCLYCEAKAKLKENV